MSESVVYRNGTENPLQSLYSAIVTSSADWGSERDRAWIYGVVVGWDDEPDDPEPDGGAMDLLAARCEWEPYDVARLRRLHEKYTQLRTEAIA